MVYCYCFYASIIFLMSGELHALTKELYQLHKSLNIVTQFLSQSSTKQSKGVLSTYEELQEVVDIAYKAKTSQGLDIFQQTIAVKVAKYLLEELIKEGELPENQQVYAYIPLVAYVVQKSVEQFPPNTTPQFNCVSLATGELENEFLLVRALRYVGYKAIRLTAIDIKYTQEEIEEYEDKFKEWSIRRRISFSNSDPATSQFPLKDGVYLLLFQETYTYITKMIEKKLADNHLFLMIQPGGGYAIAKFDDLMPPVNHIYNNLEFRESLKQDSPTVAIYLPYKQSDFFINSSYIGKEMAINKIKNFIEQWKSKFPLGHAAGYPTGLITDLFSENGRNAFENIFPWAFIGSDLSLLFCDLIRFTAIDLKNVLAFEILNLKIKALTDMSGSLEEVYNKNYKGL